MKSLSTVYTRSSEHRQIAPTGVGKAGETMHEVRANIRVLVYQTCQCLIYFNTRSAK